MLSANDIASVIVARSPRPLDQMKLLKLLYYVQAWHLAITDEPAYPEKTKAWTDGPVVPQVWRDRKDPSTRVPENQDLSTISVDPMLSRVIDAVQATYGTLSGAELSRRTHEEAPWAEARGHLSPGEPSSEEIDPRSMARFYRSHGLLNGQTAPDIAIAGFLAAEPDPEPFDVDGFLATLDVAPVGDPDEWDDVCGFTPDDEFGRNKRLSA